MSYDKLTAVLVEAIKEQQKEIEELRSMIKELRGTAHSRRPLRSLESPKIHLDTNFVVHYYFGYEKRYHYTG